MSELLPCPFCGSEDIDFEKKVGVFCRTCNVWFGVMGNNRETAADAWNRRPKNEDWINEAGLTSGAPESGNDMANGGNAGPIPTVSVRQDNPAPVSPRASQEQEKGK